MTRLEQLGRTVIANRIYQRQRAERNRQIVRIVERELMSGHPVQALQDELLKVMRKFENNHENLELLIDAEVAKL